MCINTHLPPSTMISPLKPIIHHSLSRPLFSKRALHPSRMESFANQHLAFIFGLLGNIISCFVYFAPMPTFYKIYRRRSTANFQAYPYSVALFSAMLMLYYAYLKGIRRALLLITINSFGVAIEASYLILFFIFANISVRVKTVKLITVFNMGAYLLIIAVTTMAAPNHRLKIVGWISAVLSVCVFAAPLTIIRQVIKTKSVEYMPLPLSVCLTLCAAVWLFYGVFTNDYFVGTPNVLGLLLGAAQIILYLVYMKPSTSRVEASSEMQTVANETTYAENLRKIAEEILKVVNHMQSNMESSTSRVGASSSEMQNMANQTTYAENLFMVAQEILEIVSHMRNNCGSAPQGQEPNSNDGGAPEEAEEKEGGTMEDGVKLKGRVGHEMQNAVAENGTIVIHLHLDAERTVPENGGVTDVEVDAPLEHIRENAA